MNFKKGNSMLCFILSCIIFGFSQLAYSGGIGTKLGEVWIDNVRYGVQFSLRESLNMPLKITNKSVKPVEIKMEVWINKPGDKDLIEGYEPLPDASWVTLEKEFFPRVEPGADAETDVFINIPKDKKYLGKKYQFYIWSRTTGGLSNINVGVMSRFLVSVISPENLAILEGRKKPDVIKANLDFSLLPYEIFVKQVKLGKNIDLGQLSNAGPIKVVNPNNSKLKFRIYTMSSKEARADIKKGYEDCPNPNFVTFENKEFVIPAESIKRVKAFLKFPDKEEYKGKKYQFIVVLETVGQAVVGKVYSRLYVTTEE
ncbi:MAG: hypothetical protein QME68_05540 [Elusimicrobiota bacterium]|nr:hypothetical protein [Elusimicrobiota bacterium]